MFIDQWTKIAPKHWTRRKLKHIASLRSGESITADSIKDEGEFPVYGGNGLRGFTGEYTHEGEFVLIGRQGALCGNVNYAKDRFWASEHAVVVTRLGDDDLTWLGELLRYLDLNRLSQSAAQPGISAEEVSNVLLAVPPLEEQRAISSYLKSETARLDALVAAKQRLLDLLAEKRKAIIATAVTRGLNPKVKLRDSGVPWLGEIPAHWVLKRMKYLFRLVADKAPVDNDFELLSLYTDIGVKPRRELEERGNKASSTDEYWMVERGDLVVNKLLAWMGAFGVSEYRGVTSPAYDILRPHDGVESLFYHHLFRCGVATTEVRARSYGIMDMRLRLYFDQLGDMYVPFPRVDEQRAIVEHIARETAKLDAVRAATERTIALLKERRSALIAAAVTGQLEVGAAA